MDNKTTKLLILLNSINLLIAGYLYDEGDILEVPQALKLMALDYEKKIREQEKCE